MVTASQLSAKGLHYSFPGSHHGRRKRRAQHLLAGLIVGLVTAAILAGLYYAMQL